jgi:hypothetical protein
MKNIVIHVGMLYTTAVVRAVKNRVYTGKTHGGGLKTRDFAPS